MHVPATILGAMVTLTALSLPGGAEDAGTLIAGQRYRLVPAEELVNQLVESHGDTVRYRATAFVGALSSTRLKNQSIDCVIDLEGVRFLDPVVLDGVVFMHTVRIRDSVFEGGLSMQGARFEDDADLTGMHSLTHVNFKRAAFMGSAVFFGLQVEELGSFIGAHFAGVAIFRNSRFGKTVFFEEAVFDGTADFADLNLEGISSFKDANWSGATSFAGGRFKDRADFRGSQFDGTVTFDQAMLGTFVFDRVQVGGEASFQRATFIHPARFARAVFRGTVSYAGSIFMHHADFSGARFDAGFVLASHVNRTIDLRHSSGPTLDMLLPPWQESVVRRENIFSDSARVLLQDARYDRINVRWPDLAGHLATDAEGNLAALYSVYAGLRAQFLARGQQQDATASHVDWLERRRQQLGWTDAEWYWLQLRRVTTGYGTDLWQFAQFAVASILLFAGVYRLLFSASLRSELPQRMGLSLGCLYLSLTTFLRLLPSPPQGRSTAYAIVIVQSVFSWICWGLFIATLLDLSP